MKVLLPLLSLFVLASQYAVPAAADDLAAFKQAVRAKYDLKERAFAAGDPAPILNHFYAPDVISTDNEGKTHIGRAALKPLYEDVTAHYNVRIQSVYPHVNGNTGWDWANFFVTPKAPDSKEKPFSFKILFLWQKVKGEWWCKGDMYVLGEFGRDGAKETKE